MWLYPYRPPDYGALKMMPEIFRANVAMQQSVGIDTRLVTREEARELAPSFYLEDCGIIAYEPVCGYGDASATCTSFAQAARDRGARVILRCPAVNVEVSGGRVTGVVTADGRISTDQAVIATGPWSRKFLLEHGIDLPLEATRHEVVHFRRGTEGPDYHPGGGDLINQIYFRPEGADLTLVGNGNMEDVIENPEIFAQRASPGFIQEIWSRLARRIPALADAGFSTGYAGLYTSTPDSHPVIDAVEGIEGLYVCTGFSGHGFKLSPMVGTLVAELMLDGRAKSIDITPLRMSRFAEGDLEQHRLRVQGNGVAIAPESVRPGIQVNRILKISLTAETQSNGEVRRYTLCISVCSASLR